MNEVFLLWHVRSDDEYGDDAKLVGVYRSEEKAQATMVRLGKQPGFVEHPNGWEISRYQPDRDHWQEGFVTVIRD